MLIALWVILVLALIWLALTELPAGWDGAKPLPFLIALTPMLYLVFIVLVIWGVCIHNWSFTACAAVGLLASLMRKTSYVLNDLKTPNTGEMIARKLAAKNNTEPSTTAQSAHHDGQFNVMTLNCRIGRADAAHIVQLVRDHDIAVLALQECTPALIERLNTAGLHEVLPYHQLGDAHPNDNGGFNGIWLRVEPASSTATGVPIPAADVPAVTLPLSATRDITFASAHTKSPQRSCREWSQGIIGLRALATEHPANTADDHENIAVLLGDLNSGIEHPSFRKLLAGGFHDAALDEARGMHATFPSYMKWPRMILDHILFTNYLHASNVQSIVVQGTDHCALLATLTVTNTQEPINPAARESWPDALPKIQRK